MERKPLCPPSLLPPSAAPQASTEAAEIDLIFMPDLGLIPKRMVTTSRPALRPAGPRKWLGTDFSHVSISQ